MAVVAVSSVVLLMLGSLASRVAAATIPSRTTSSAVPGQMTPSATTSGTMVTSRDLQTLSSVVAASSTDVTTLHDFHLTDLSIPPEVITEALFSQIDVIQDLLEQCEETARNNLNGDSSQETVDMDDNSVDEDVDNSRDLALAASLLFLRGGDRRNLGTASLRAQPDGEELLPETADKEDASKGGGDEGTGVSNRLLDSGGERDDVMDGGGEVIGDETDDDGFEVGDKVERGDGEEELERKEDRTGKGDEDLREDRTGGKRVTEFYYNDSEDDVRGKEDEKGEKAENKDRGGDRERKVTSNKIDVNDGPASSTTTTTISSATISSATPSLSKTNLLRTDIMETPETKQSLSTPGIATSHDGEIHSLNTLNLNENTTGALNESDNGGDVHRDNFASETDSDLGESSGEITLPSKVTSRDELHPVALPQGGNKNADVDVSAGGHRTRRSVALLKETAGIISVGESENELTSEWRGESHVPRFERQHTIRLKSENSFSRKEHAHRRSGRDDTLIALKTFAERIESGRRLRKLLDNEQLFVAEKEYKREVSKERSSDDEGLEAAILNEGRQSKPVGVQHRPSQDPKTREAKTISTGIVNSKSSDLNKKQSSRRTAEMEHLFAGTSVLASKSERLRARRSADQETSLNPERFVPLIGHLVERLDYLKRSLADCHALLDSEQEN